MHASGEDRLAQGLNVDTGNNSHPNLFSRDIFDLLYQKSGAHPFIRVGGTST